MGAKQLYMVKGQGATNKIPNDNNTDRPCLKTVVTSCLFFEIKAKDLIHQTANPPPQINKWLTRGVSTGKMAERFKARVCRTIGEQGSGRGNTPSL